MKDMLRTGWLIWAVALLPLQACSNDDYIPSPTGTDSGPGGRGVSDANFWDMAIPDGGGDGDQDGSQGDAPDAPLPTTITITVQSPAPAAVAPAAVRFTPALEVRVESPASQAGDTLDDVTVEVLLLPQRTKAAVGKLNQVGLDALPESNVVVYRFADTPIDVAAAASGNYELLVIAKTKGGVEGRATVPFQIDGGPSIRVDTPVADRSYRGSAPIDVTIGDDFFGPISDVQMKVGQHTVTFAGPGGPSGKQYTATLDFASYMPALEGEQILTVRAKNRNGTESVVTRKFVSDSKGPTITEARPKDGDLVGNVVTIQAEVKDPAGVLASSVVAVFANGPGTEYTIPLNAPAPGATPQAYSAIFDTRLLPFGENALYPTLSFRASDSLGNESLLTNVVWLDNKPPLAELDPPEMRMLARNEGNVYACSWPFDPVGPDAADDLDVVPQIVDIRARVEDKGNDPLSGSPNYIPISGVDVAQLLILDDTSQPLIVNTNPVPKGNKQADTLCDALNPLLVPTTRPMTAKDALLVTLFPIQPAGIPDLTNTATTGVTLIGDDLSCAGGGNTKIPDPACEVTGNIAKAKWRIVTTVSPAFIDLHSEVVRIFPGYGGVGAGLLPSIYTIPKQEAGAANALCGGTQLDTLANFVSDGWACLAVFASDRLGNKQVSKPMRICVDKDLDGKECPHKEIAAVRDTTPLTVETVADHGYATGDQVKVSGIFLPAIVNGTWTVTATGPRSFTLNGSQGPTVAAGIPYQWTRPSQPVGQPKNFIAGHVVRTSDAPNCTGTQTVEPPMTAVDATACSPWRTYAPGEIRRF
jgi:hypothetical protein